MASPGLLPALPDVSRIRPCDPGERSFNPARDKIWGRNLQSLLLPSVLFCGIPQPLIGNICAPSDPGKLRRARLPASRTCQGTRALPAPWKPRDFHGKGAISPTGSNSSRELTPHPRRSPNFSPYSLPAWTTQPNDSNREKPLRIPKKRRERLSHPP